jgi:cytochrome c oxidase subunit 2
VPQLSVPRLSVAGGLAVAAAFFGTHAQAQQPEPWGLYFQDPATPVAEAAVRFHDLLLWVTTLIALFVFVLLGYILIRFRASAKREVSGTTHNTLLEVAWTGIPVLILVMIAIPSFRLLYFAEDFADADLTVKAIGHAWYWEYEYPDNGGFYFDSRMLPDDARGADDPRLLAVDNRLVVPSGTKIRLLVTSADVLHAFAVPAFTIKLDAVPGRVNETWFLADRPGVYYGQCSELCGRGHGYMPIAVEVVPSAEFDAWVAQAQTRFANAAPNYENTVASVLTVPNR